MESDNRNCQELESDDGTSDSTALVRRQSYAKEVNAKPSAWLFATTVFKRLDSRDVKILTRA